LRLGAGRQYKVSQDATLNVEVTSESTAEIDRREKLVAYQKLPGLRAYWIASQDTQRVEAHERDASGRWQAMAYGCGEALLSRASMASLCLWRRCTPAGLRAAQAGRGRPA
jgi:Uma2 family endonuclease